MQNLVKDATNVVRLRRLRDDVEEDWLGGAEALVTGTLKTAAGVDVAGATDLNMVWVAGERPELGEYRATISHSVALTVGASYTLVVTAIATNGRRTFHVPCTVIAG